MPPRIIQIILKILKTYPLIKNLEWNESPLYIESASKNSEKKGITIGIRNSKFKYIRSRIEKTKNIILYDLKNDPNETKNVALHNPQIVEEMEKILQKIHENSSYDSIDMSDEQSKEIENELKKLGYI